MEVEFFSPNEARFLTLFHNLFKEAAEDIDAIPYYLPPFLPLFNILDLSVADQVGRVEQAGLLILMKGQNYNY